MSDTTTLRVVSTHEVERDRVAEWVLANAVAGDKVELVDDHTHEDELLLDGRISDVDDFEKRVETALEKVKA